MDTKFARRITDSGTGVGDAHMLKILLKLLQAADTVRKWWESKNFGNIEN